MLLLSPFWPNRPISVELYPIAQVGVNHEPTAEFKPIRVHKLAAKDGFYRRASLLDQEGRLPMANKPI